MSDIKMLEREAGEHIDNLNAGLHVADENMTCKKLHGDTVRALKWVIRTLESLAKQIFQTRGSGEHRMLKAFGCEIPIERGLTFRDLIILCLFLAVLYVHLHDRGVIQ